MVQNSKFTIQLLDKIGSPLAAAIEAVPVKGDDQEEQAAKIMAQLLGQAVQISISLNSSFNVVEEEAQADSTRLALAAMAAPLLAKFYRENEAVPQDADIKRLTKSLESVVAFSDNFSAAEEEKSRLTTLDADAPLFDKTQSALVVMQAMTPVIMAVGDFAFGHSETKLIQEIVAKCEAKANDLAKNLKLEDKLSELMILKALASLYAECHRNETQRLANSASDDSRGELSMDPVWDAFATRVAMIEAVMGLESAEPKVTKAPEPQKTESTPPSPTETKQKEAQSSSPSSPMGFFKKPDANAAPADPPPAVPATPTPQDAPVETEQAQPEAPQPEEKPAESSSDNTAQAPSNPMGFFKPGAKKANEGENS